MRIRVLARARVSYEYRRIRALLNREGWTIGRDPGYRLYKDEGLVLTKPPARCKGTVRSPRQKKIQATKPNQIWSLDFVSDQLANGLRFRALTIVGLYTRESLAIEVGVGLKGPMWSGCSVD